MTGTRTPSLAQLMRIARAPSRFGPSIEQLNPPFTPPGPVEFGNSLSHPEFTRAQTRIAAAYRNDDEPDLADLDTEARFLPPLTAAWLEKLKPWNARDLVFRRGRVERLSLAGRAFVSLGQSLFESVPLRGLLLVGVKWLMHEVMRSPLLNRLERLDLSGNQWGDDAVQQIVDRTNLRHIDVSGNALSRCPRLPSNLTSVVISNNRIEDLSDLKGTHSLDASGTGGRHFDIVPLKHLRMADNDLSIVPRLPRLTRLDLSGNALESLRPLADMPLTRLTLRGCRLRAIDTPLPLTLTRLDLSGNFLGDSIDHFPLTNLRRLSLANCLATDTTVRRLIDRPPNLLTHLDLSWNRVGDEALIALARCPAFASLRILNVSGTRVSRRGLRVLRESPVLARTAITV